MYGRIGVAGDWNSQCKCQSGLEWSERRKDKWKKKIEKKPR